MIDASAITWRLLRKVCPAEVIHPALRRNQSKNIVPVLNMNARSIDYGAQLAADPSNKCAERDRDRCGGKPRQIAADRVVLKVHMS
eukprot:6175228-Pleurochrysis_carterae.AAC.1